MGPNALSRSPPGSEVFDGGVSERLDDEDVFDVPLAGRDDAGGGDGAGGGAFVMDGAEDVAAGTASVAAGVSGVAACCFFSTEQADVTIDTASAAQVNARVII